MNKEDIYTRKPQRLDPAIWEVIQDFTREVIAEVMTKDPTFNLESIKSVTVHHITYCYRHGVALNRQDIFNENTITRHYDHDFTGSRRTLVSYRATARRIAAIINNSYIPRRAAIPRDDLVAKPYSAQELDRLHDWAESAGTDNMRTNRWRVLALAGGAGLRAREIKGLRWKDIEQHGTETFINLPDRFTPVSELYEEELYDRGEPNEYVVFPRRTRRETSLHTMMFEKRDNSGIAIDTRRMRSTWIVGLMRAGLNEKLICRVAGLSSLNNWDVYRATFDDADVFEMSAALAFKQSGLRVVT